MKNIIILTSGLDGSSVLAALLAKKGYWSGESTVVKEDYNTWENATLVELNKKLLDKAGIGERWLKWFEPTYFRDLDAASKDMDPAPFVEFIKTCDAHQPWVWKDPRLWVTLPYWLKHLDTENICFCVIQREPRQAWIASVLRRQIQSMRHSLAYRADIHASITQLLQQHQLPFVDIVYERLLLQPEAELARIGQAAGGLDLTLSDLLAVFRGRLYARQHGIKSFVKASAIYIKNFRHRYG